MVVTHCQWLAIHRHLLSIVSTKQTIETSKKKTIFPWKGNSIFQNKIKFIWNQYLLRKRARHHCCKYQERFYKSLCSMYVGCIEHSFLGEPLKQNKGVVVPGKKKYFSLRKMQSTLWLYKMILKHLLNYRTKLHYIDFVWPLTPSSHLTSSVKQTSNMEKCWEMASM